MPKNNEDLFQRAATAAQMVTNLTADLKVTRDRLAKAKTEARSLKRQVWEALGGRPRKTRKVKAGSIPAGVEGAPQSGGSPGRPEANRQPSLHPLCWFNGCGKPSVKAVGDLSGATWECCADHLDTTPPWAHVTSSVNPNG